MYQVEINEKNDHIEMDFSGTLGISDANELLKSFKELDPKKKYIINTKKVSDVDIVFFQILTSFRISGAQVALSEEMSKTVRTALKTLGLTNQFMN